jgi:hypothetical protein
MPRPRHGGCIWVCFDLDNKDGQRYLWWFKRKAEALEHRHLQHEKNGARLSYPQKWVRESRGE